MPLQPSWLFDSSLLRRALAQLNLSAVPAIVRAACGLSQRELAEIAGWSQASLSYCERGVRDGIYDIRTAWQFCDSVGMPRQALLPLVFADADASLPTGTGDGAVLDLSRRGSGSLAAAGLPAALPPGSAPRRVTSSHVRYWLACADTLYVRERSVGGTILLPLAVQQWRRAQLALRHSAGQAGRELLSAAGELALCTGWIAVDGGQLALAGPLYEEASELAAGSGDALLAVHVLTNQSMLHAELARAGPSRAPARQALRLAFEAQEEGRYLPVPQLHALIALRHASAASLLGDRAAFQGAITQARRELDRSPQAGEPPEWLRFIDHVEITAVQARGWLNLGDPARSAPLYRQVLASRLSPPDRARYGAGLADALLKQGAHQEAVAMALDVLLALEGGGVASMRCLNQLRPIRQAAGGTVEAEELRGRFDAAERALTAACSLPGDDALRTNGEPAGALRMRRWRTPGTGAPTDKPAAAIPHMRTAASSWPGSPSLA